MTQILITPDVLEKEFVEAFTRVWETQFGLALQKSDFPDDQEEKWLAGVVWLGGQWTGSVTIAFPYTLANTVAARALEISEEQVTKEQARDCIKEIANMCAGNLKSALPGPAGLATPGWFEVSHLNELESEFPLVMAIHYKCGELPISAELRGLE